MINPAGALFQRWLEVAGGPARARVLFLLALALGLDTADVGSIGAIAGKLEHSLSLSNTQLGLLVTTVALCSALATVPMGILADRTSRARLLWVSMLAWSAAEAVSGAAQSFQMLLLIRVALGIATAAALPAVASLVGDLFRADERGRIWGLVLGGELIGAAFGYLVAGEATTFGAGSWRYAFYLLAIPSLCGALAVRRWLPEPARGGRGRLEPGSTGLVTAEDPAGGPHPPADGFEESKAQKKVAHQGVPPRPELVLDSDPEQMGLRSAARYVMRIPTNVVLIVASALGYFYFTGLTTFGLVYFVGRYHVSHGEGTLLLGLLGLGGLVGVVGGGRIADRWLSRGAVNSRITVGALSFALAAVLLLPGLLAARVQLSLPLLILAATAFGARNPPLDAARLDIMHHRLWGRAEAIRTLLRRTMIASAPIVFGVIADQLVPPGGHASQNGTHGFGASANAQGLQKAFLILLITLALGGILTFLARRTYPRDVATALASEANATPPGERAPLSEAA